MAARSGDNWLFYNQTEHMARVSVGLYGMGMSFDTVRTDIIILSIYLGQFMDTKFIFLKKYLIV